MKALSHAFNATRILALTTAISLPLATPALAYDMDCKLILCLAGGFPGDCKDAKAYMLARLRAVPRKPPIGICTGYDGHSVDLGMARPKRTDPDAYDCEDPDTKLYFSRNEQANSQIVNVFCYDAALPDIEMDPETGRLNTVMSTLEKAPATLIDFVFEFSPAEETPSQVIRLNIASGYARIEDKVEPDPDSDAQSDGVN